MATVDDRPFDVRSVSTLPRLILLWQDPASRRYYPVGSLDLEFRESDGLVSIFNYLSAARREPGFAALESFPNLDVTYITVGLPPFFSNRLMSSSRPSYATFLRDLGAAGGLTPWDEFALTGGERATDTFSVFPLPTAGLDRRLSLRFFIHGVRHIGVADDVLLDLRAGEPLYFLREETNPVDPDALLVVAVNQVRLGWLPRWLQGVVDEIFLQDSRAQLTLEQINGGQVRPDRRILCRLDAVMPDDWAGFDLDPSLRSY